MAAGTIEALRKVQWGFEGTAATGTLTLAVQPTAADTHTIGDITYTWVASGATEADNEINVGADLAAAKTNFLAAVNGTGDYTANPAVTASAFTGDVSTLTARNKGTAGNSIATTETFTSGSNIFSGTTLSSGAGGHGTSVAATSIVAIQRMQFDDTDEKIFNPSFATGILARRRGRGSPTQHGTRWSFSDEPVVWEQLPHWLSLFFKGGVTPVLTGGVYRWTFTVSPTSNPNLDSATFERYLSNGEGGAIEQECSYAMGDSYTLKFAEGDTLKHSGGGFARALSTASVTSALSLPDPQLGVSALSKVYVDDAWGSVGGTLLSEQVIGWEFMRKNGAMPLLTAEGRTGLDFTKHIYNANESQVSLKLRCLVDPTTYADENGHAAAGDTRAIQVLVTGSGSRSLKINALMRHVKPFYAKVDEVNGQDVVDYELEEAPDTTNFLQAILDHPTVYTKA